MIFISAADLMRHILEDIYGKAKPFDFLLFMTVLILLSLGLIHAFQRKRTFG